MTYRYTKLDENNIVDLVPLYRDAFGKDISLKELDDKFNTDFTSINYVGYIAYADNDQAAAFYGVLPCFADYRGEKLLVAQSGNTMTHSLHRGKGLFTQLALKTYEYCKEQNIHLVFGFPNENSFPGFVKYLDWEHFDNIESFVIRSKGISWYSIHKYIGINDSVQTWWGDKILRALKKGVVFPASSKAQNTPVIDHSKEFFDYKTYEKNYLVNVAGTNMWLKFNKNFLYIGDAEYSHEKQLSKAIKRLIWLSRLMFIPHLRFQGSSNTELTNFFSKNGRRLETTQPIGGINFSMEIPMEKMKFTMADNDTF